MINNGQISKSLDDNQAILAEAIQTVLRSIGYPNPYEALKDLTRTNQKITAESISVFIDNLDVDEDTGVQVEVVQRSDFLQELGGVGCLLRYKDFTSAATWVLPPAPSTAEPVAS